ncbi:unnamed protein product [Gongylonema pulchrum]|uniref:Uncharacterized protein n=1 Tax=Gongylonema pulchrum TaxID=637853 RepID=A0A3P7P4C4_9BILA|nr:unnamed protein product [Gongylonema pulchrum]
MVHSVSSNGCPVSCLNFNNNGTHLAIGYGSGLLRIFNIATGKMADETNEVVQPGKGILQVIFVGSSKRLACLDSGGSVVYLKMLDNDRILAFLSLRKLFLISLKEMRLIYAAALTGPANRPPLFDWQARNEVPPLQNGSKNSIFCAGRGSKVEFFHISNSGLDSKVTRYR